MKKFIILPTLALTAIFAGNAMANNNAPAQGGFAGPTIAPVSVAEALKMSDDTAVAIVGKIEKNLGKEKYQFTDGKDTIIVEIDDEDWKGLTVNPEDTIEIRGEIDKDFTSVEVDVDTVVKK